jgi:hypothetical protein
VNAPNSTSLGSEDLDAKRCSCGRNRPRVRASVVYAPAMG